MGLEAAWGSFGLLWGWGAISLGTWRAAFNRSFSLSLGANRQLVSTAAARPGNIGHGYADLGF